MTMRKVKWLMLTICVGGLLWTVAYGAEIRNVTARQRFPWNGLVDITCKVSGTTNRFAFAVAAIVPDTGSIHKASRFWIVQNGTNFAAHATYGNGDYRLLWDAEADLGHVIYSNMVVRVTFDTHEMVQLWEDGPYWATTNIGAEEPHEYGYYFWWGDVVGYKRDGDTWVATDGSSSNFSFWNTPPDGKTLATLQSERWVGASYELVSKHDAAQMQWGYGWRMPLTEEFGDLERKCDWQWVSKNGVNGYMVRGRGAYTSSSIFLPCTGYGYMTSLYDAGSCGRYWSRRADGDNSSKAIGVSSSGISWISSRRSCGMTIRPVKGL